MKDSRELYLRDLKHFGEKNDIPNVSITNARFLRDLIKIHKPQRILEIWTANAFSTINMGLECEKYGAVIDTIEFSLRAYDLATENIKNTKLTSTICQHFGNALDIVPNLEHEYDFVFIDGMKRRSKSFFEDTFPKLKTWGIMIIDDVILFREKMLDLYEELEKRKIIYNVIPIDVNDGVIMIIK